MNGKLTVAAFGAHPDDIEMQMLGTLLRYKELGHKVYTVIATDGCRGGGKPDAEMVNIRMKEMQASASHTGFDPILLGFEDGRLVYDGQTYEKVAEVYGSLKPDVVITHDPNDYHADHRAISRLVTDVSWVPVFFSDPLGSVNFEPQFFVDISDQFELKLKAVSEHVTMNPPVLREQVEVTNRFRAMQCGRKGIRYAEAYRLFPRIGFVLGYELLPGYGRL